MKKAKIAMAMILALMMVLTGCATTQSATSPSPSVEPSATPTSAEPTADDTSESPVDMSGVTLRVQYTFPADSNLFALAGLDDTPYKLEFYSYTGSNLALQAIATDNLDLARSSDIPPLYAVLAESDSNFSVVAVEKMYLGKQALIIAPESPIESVADLKGQKVGYVMSTSAQYFLAKMLEEAGLAWGEVETINLSPSDGLAALMGGEIAAMAVFGNQITACEQAGGSVLQDATPILSGNTYWEANKLSLKDPAKAAAIVDYLQRTEKLEEWIRTHHQEYADVMADKYYGMTVPDFIKYLEEGEAVRENHVFSYTETDITALQDVADILYATKALEKEIDVATMFSDQLSADIQTALDAIQ
jgi:sulfonate transport system substrate-binding protein